MKTLHRHGLPVAFVLVWSSAYVAGSIVTERVAPLTVTLWRFAIAALLLGLFARWRRERWPRGVRELAGVSAIGVLLFALQFTALYSALAQHMPAATTALIACSSPLLVAAISALAGWERLSPRRWLGSLLGVLGVVITLADRVGRPPSVAALLWTLLGLAGLVAGTLLQGRLRIAADPAAMASVELIASALVLVPIAPLFGSLAIPPTATALFAFGYVAIIAGIGSPLLLFMLIAQRGATGASSLLFVVPSITAGFAWIVLGAPLHATALIGLVVAALGMWLARATARSRGRSRQRRCGRSTGAARRRART